jgi:hypothetical protein
MALRKLILGQADILENLHSFHQSLVFRDAKKHGGGSSMMGDDQRPPCLAGLADARCDIRPEFR